MNNTNSIKQNQIIEAFSTAIIPDSVIEDSQLKELIGERLKGTVTVQEKMNELDNRRQEKSKGNVFGNLLNNRKEKVNDAQFELNKSIGFLTEKSSLLLIVNTAISKMLMEHQTILSDQQDILKQQTNDIKTQNEKILDQQEQIKQQQLDINAANQGLLEAKGLTQAQAQQLVGCVQRVIETEKKIEISNQELREFLDKQITESISECNTSFIKQLEAVYQSTNSYEQKVSELIQSSNQVQSNINLAKENFETKTKDLDKKIQENQEQSFELFNDQKLLLSNKFSSIDSQIIQHQKILRNNRFVIFISISLSLISLVTTIVKHIV